MTVTPEPLSEDVNPYPVTEPIPYNPEDPEFTDPVTPVPEPDREYLTAEEAINRHAAAEAEANPPPPPPVPGEAPMVTEYKASYAG